MVGCVARQSRDSLAVLAIIRRAKFESGVIYSGDLLELLLIFFGKLSEELKKAANNEVPNLFEECTGL